MATGRIVEKERNTQKPGPINAYAACRKDIFVQPADQVEGTALTGRKCQLWIILRRANVLTESAL